MISTDKYYTFLMADDDPDDYLLLKEALAEQKINGQLLLVSDGAELMDYLLLRGKFSAPEEAPKPHLIFLDLNIKFFQG